jgi:hypothetical protein
MTVSSTIEQKRRGRDASTAPADAATKVLGIDGFCDEATKNRVSNIVHWGYGTAWGAVRGLLDAAGLSPAAATVAHGAALWGSEQVMLPALGVAPPLWEWGAVEVGIDAGITPSTRSRRAWRTRRWVEAGCSRGRPCGPAASRAGRAAAQAMTASS